ncbi:MAG TPA: exodeoxyribonuclease V subunit gamma [Lysobacter sp.]|nr:exodeoxyribonuclease V subunit gamma [Lysobacter sp.]
MGPVSGLRIYYSNALDVLAGLLARTLAQPAPDGDWLRPDVVLVPQFAMRRWLQQELATQAGICANLQILTPGEFVDRALDSQLGPAPAGDRLAPEVARWHLLRALEQDPPAALRGYLNDGDALRRWSLAEALAQTFERYQAWRRDWLLDWERGRERDWQAELWRRIARSRSHRARRIDAYLRRFGADGGEMPLGLPARLFVFACQNVSPDVLQVILSQARAGEQHYFVHTPARAYWGDVRRFAADYAPAEDERFAGDNPLLAAWGQAGRDFIAALASGEAGHAQWEAQAFVEPSTDTLLGRLQRDALDNRAPCAAAEPGWPRAAVDRSDASLQFHACHTRLREVQVLHDQLRALLERPGTLEQPALEPRDIAVLAPDIDAYAPHIEAVFGGALGTPREIPYTIADTSPLASASLAGAFLRVLELPLRALAAGELVDLLAVPAVAARFGLDDAARGRVQTWLEQAGARWAFDAADRARLGVPAEEAYTLRFALERLLLGYALGADAGVERVAAWPELEGQDAETLDRLLQAVALLRQAATELAGAHPPARWGEKLDALLSRLFAVERDGVEARVLERIRAAVGSFAQSALDAGFDAPVPHAVVLAQLRRALAEVDARAPFLSGGVCFGRMVPMRLIPFRVICLLGMDEAAFPARDPHDELNRLTLERDTLRRRVGDPSLRDADRFLFLQLFASAGRVFYVSWPGFDPRDGHARPPAAPVAELLDAAAACHVAADAGERAALRAALVVRHALQPYSAANFGAPRIDEAAPDLRRFSFDARWHAAAAAAVGTRAPLAAFAPQPVCIAGEPERVLTLDRLRRALMRPPAFFLQEGVRLRLPEEEPALPEHEPLGEPDALERYRLQTEVFARWLRSGERPHAPALHDAFLARAWVAPGEDGRRALQESIDCVAPYAERALDAGFRGDGATVPYTLELGAVHLQGTLAGVHGERVLRVALRPKGRHGGHALRHGLDRLVAARLGLTLVELANDRDGAPVAVRETAFSASDIDACLAALVALRERARTLPLPFLPKSAYAAWCALAAGRDEHAALDCADELWRGSDRTAGEADAATRLALRGRDPFLDGDAEACAHFLALARAVFDALETAAPFDVEALA